MSVFAIVLSTVVMFAMVLGPGFAVLQIAGPRAGSTEAVGDRLALATLLGVMVLAAVTAALLAVGRFSGATLAGILLIVSVAGLPQAWQVARQLVSRHRFGIAIALALSIPWIVSASVEGYPRSSTLQWYYWELGRSMTEVQGIPAAVLEYGRMVRWLPDYLIFNALSEAYRAVSAPFVEAVAISAWRVPVVLAAIAAIFGLLRLSLRPSTAWVGVGLIVLTTAFTGKFNVYKPEAIGLVVGLIAVIAMVRGIRSGRPAMIVVAGGAMGIAMAIHAIAATVMAGLLVGYGLAEWWASPGRRSVVMRQLVSAAVVSMILVVGVGLAFQGRAVVATDALRPDVVDGVDQTWVYVLQSDGLFLDRVPRTPSILRQLSGSVTSPWPFVDFTTIPGVVVLLALAAGVALAFNEGAPLVRRGIVGVLIGLGVLLAGMAFFGLAFDTFVPRHTGLDRFGQYMPIFVATLAAFALDAVWARVRARNRVSALDKPQVRAAIVASAVVAVALAIDIRFASDPRLSSDGLAALQAARAMVAPDQAILTNAITPGSVEAFTGREAPMEGRQPLIEDSAFLAYVNRTMAEVHDFFESPVASAPVLQRLDVAWLLVVDDPATLGVTRSYGGGVDLIRATPGLTVRWSASGVALFEVLDSTNHGPRTTSRPPATGRILMIVLAGAVGIAGSLWVAGVLPGRRIDRRGVPTGP